jgi:lysophospholipase L1-like esterase
MRRVLIGALLTVLLSLGAVTAGAVATNSGQTRAVVLFVGDSNVIRGAGEIEMAVSRPDNQYVPVLAARVGARIRTPDCLDPWGCKTFDYWRYKLATLRSKVNPDAIVSNLGINDASDPGTPDGPGYAFYGRKIDWFMNLVGGERVLWTSLPCDIEPRDLQKGCTTVNYELFRAVDRWPNLTVLHWGQRALGHPEYMQQPGSDVHYSEAGYAAWSALVVEALNARFAAP